MIVRILGEGQFDVSDSDLEQVNLLDTELEAAIEAGDETRFTAALSALLDAIRSHGRPHELDSLDASDVIVPGPDSSLDEVRDMLGDEGLIPG